PVNARLAHPGGLQIDEPGIDPAQFLVAEAPLVHLARAEVFADRVRIADHPLEQVSTLGMVEIESDAVFAGVGIVEVGTAVVVAADAVAVGDALRAPSIGARIVGSERRRVADKVDRPAVAPFDSDHLGAEGSQQAGGLRPDLQPGQVDYAHALERSGDLPVAGHSYPLLENDAGVQARR